MELWFLILISISIGALVHTIFSPKKLAAPHRLPPGPPTFPIIGNIIWLRRSFFELELILRSLRQNLGPVVTLHVGPRPAIFVADRSLAHQALVQNGAVYADRPPVLPTSKIISSNGHNINTSPYGPTWRLLRRNLTLEILNPSRIKSYSHARKWVLQILQHRLESRAKSGDPILVMDDFQYAMFCLLVLMCFGDKLNENQIKQIEKAQRMMLLNLSKYNILNIWPKVTKILLRRKWEELRLLRKNQEDVLIPLIRARKRMQEEMARKTKEDKEGHEDHERVVSFVETLLGLELPEEKRKLTEDEIVSNCSEFLNAGTDTTSTALQWIMANLVKYQQIQDKLSEEIKKVMEDRHNQEEVKEEDLQKMPYLKAIILEGLRRHPPAHFVLPHAVTEDVVLDKYVIPKNGSINFMVAEMGWDPKVWEDPMAFKPERFLNNGDNESFDITGSKEIKMMPFGAGRRICPGYGLAMLHLEYFVANLIWKFQWKAVDNVDLSEKQEFTIVMKNPLKARISPKLK